MSGDHARLGQDLATRLDHRAAADLEGPGAGGSLAARNQPRVRMDHPDRLERDPQRARHHLGQGRLVALPVRGQPRPDRGRPVPVDLDRSELRGLMLAGQGDRQGLDPGEFA